MNHPRLPKPLIVAGLAVLALAGAAEAIIIYDFPIFGVANGTQTARINVVLTQPPPDQDCPVALTFIDSQGNQIGDPGLFRLRGGAAVHTDFVGDPQIRALERLEIRAQVTLGNPDEFPGCAVGVLASVEVFDKLTRATHIILTNLVRVETPAPQ